MPAQILVNIGSYSGVLVNGIKPLAEPPQIAKFMGRTWGPPGSCRPQMDPMLAPWTLLSGTVYLSSNVLCGIQLRAVPQEMLMNLISVMTRVHMCIYINCTYVYIYIYIYQLFQLPKCHCSWHYLVHNFGKYRLIKTRIQTNNSQNNFATWYSKFILNTLYS